MKNILVLTVFALVSLVSFSQEKDSVNIKPVSLSFSSGQGALSSGPLLSANFTVEDDLLNFTIGERDIYVAYMKKISNSLYSGPSFEFYHNIPTLGLMSNLNILSYKDFNVSALNWFGFSAGEPDQKVDFSKSQLLFFFQSIDLSYKNLSLCSAALWYEEWGYLFDLKYKQPLTKHFSSFVSGGYSFYKDGNYLFQIGLSYKF